MVRYAYDFTAYGVSMPCRALNDAKSASALKYSFGVVFCLVPERVKVSPNGCLADICLDICRKGHKQRILEADW